jgi:hypothetical protein
MPSFEKITLSLPAHWICPVLYGDTTGMDDVEEAAFNRWLDDTVREVGHGQVPLIGKITDSTYFARYHDAAEYGVLACDCYDVEMLVPVSAATNKGAAA